MPCASYRWIMALPRNSENPLSSMGFGHATCLRIAALPRSLVSFEIAIACSRVTTRWSKPKSTTPSQKFAILYGIWACYYVGGEVAIRAAAEEFLAEAERHDVMRKHI